MLAWLRRRSLRSQVFLIIVLTIGPALALIVVGARIERDKDRARAESDLSRLLDLVTGAHQLTIDETTQLLGALRRVPSVANHEADCPTVLAEVQAAHEEYVELGVAAPDGRIVCSAAPLATLPDAAGAAWFQRAVATRAFARGDYEIGPVAQHPVLVLAQPVVDGTTVRSVVFAAINLDYLRRLAALTSLPEGGALVFARRDGLVLARHPDPTFAWTGRTLPDTPLFQAMRRLDAGVALVSGIDHAVRLWVFHPVGTGNDAWLAIGFPPSIVYGPSEQALRRNLIVLGLVSFATLVLAWFATRAALRPLDELAVAARRLARGELGARIDRSRGAGEVAQLAAVFDQMSVAVAERESSLCDTAAALEARTDELHRLLERFADVREEEAIRISREVHDVIGSALTALRMDVTWVRKHFADAKTVEGRAALEARIAEALALVDSTTETVRRVATSLRPVVLDDLGLAAAIEWQAEELASRVGLRLRLDVDQEIAPGARSATAVFRIFQEIGTNVARHAQASALEVRLRRDGARLVLEVTDDGVGMPAASALGRSSLGLLGMRERAAQCGGTVKFSSASPHGTMVTVSLPWEDERHEGAAGR